MSLADGLKDIATEIGRALLEQGQNAVVDAANTYRAVMMQDVGWNVQSVISDMTQQRAQEISNNMVESANSNTLDAERSL